MKYFINRLVTTILVASGILVPAFAFAQTVPVTGTPGCPPGAYYNYLTGEICTSGSTNNGDGQTVNTYNGASITVLTNPTLKTKYDAANHEASLGVAMTVKITAGTKDIPFPTWAFQINLHDVTNTKYSPGASANFVPTGGTMTGGYFTIPAGQSATFALTASFDPRILFAGQYYASFDFVNAGFAGDVDHSTSVQTPANKSNIITVVGERSPYITSDVANSARVTILGQRFANYQNEIYIDGVRLGSPTTYFRSTNTGKNIAFSLKTYPIAAGTHTLQVKHVITGLSNNVNLMIDSGTIATTTSCTPYNRSLTVGSQGDDVIALQNYLASKNYLSLSNIAVIGVFDDATKRGVAVFEAAVGINPADGYFGPIARAYLAASCPVTGVSNLTIGADVTNPPAQSYRVNPNSGLQGAKMLAFAAKSSDGDSRINTLVVNWSISNGPGYPTALYLYNSDGTILLASAATGGNKAVIFNNLNLLVQKDHTNTYLIKADFPSSMAEGAKVWTNLTLVNYEQPNSKNIEISTNVAGNTMTFNSVTAETSFISGTAQTTLSTSGLTSSVNGIFVLKVRPVGGSMAVPVPSDFKLYLGATSEKGVPYDVTPTSVTVNGNPTVLSEGGDYTITVTGLVSGAAFPSGSTLMSMRMTSISAVIAGKRVTQTEGLDNYRTSGVLVTGGTTVADFTAPTASLVSSKLALSYDATQKESALTGSFTVILKAGSKEARFFSNVFGVNVLDQNSKDANLNNFSRTSTLTRALESYNDQYGRLVYKLPAGQQVAVIFANTVQPKDMFAGTYIMKLGTIYSPDPVSPGNSIEIPVTATTNAVTIVGENVTAAARFPGDINGDGIVDFLDLARFGQVNGSHVGQSNYIVDADFNHDGSIDSLDLAILNANYNKSATGGAVQGASTQCTVLTHALAKGSMDLYADGEVTLLQGFLTTQGYGFPEKGTFGSVTETAVKSWQAKQGIEATGIVGALTRTAIQEVSCN